MRKYYVQAIDVTTGESVFCGMVAAETIADAGLEGHRLAAMAAGHLRVRVTQVAEQDTTAAEHAAQNLLTGQPGTACTCQRVPIEGPFRRAVA